MGGEAGGLSLDLRAEAGFLERLLQLIEDGLLRRRKVGRGIDAVRGEMLAPMRAPYLDGVLHGKQRRELAGRAAGNQGEMDRGMLLRRSRRSATPGQGRACMRSS